MYTTGLESQYVCWGSIDLAESEAKKASQGYLHATESSAPPLPCLRLLSALDSHLRPRPSHTPRSLLAVGLTSYCPLNPPEFGQGAASLGLNKSASSLQG